MEGPVAPNPNNPDNNTNANANQNNDNDNNNNNDPPSQNAPPPNLPAPNQPAGQPAPQQSPPNQPAPHQLVPNQPGPANPGGPTPHVSNLSQPFPYQPAPQIIHQQMRNWSHLKPEFTGRSEEDAEAHLLRTNDWMRTHNFDEDMKVQRFCLTLLGEARLWSETLTPIAKDWPALQNNFR